MPRKDKLSAEEVAEFKRTLCNFKKAWGQSIPDDLLERRALDAVLNRRKIDVDNT